MQVDSKTSIFKKIKSIAAYGINPISEGKSNYETPSTDIEVNVQQRAAKCADCPHNTPEPISFLKVEDTRTPELSGKMCAVCGCALPYLLRQNQKICKYWEDDQV